jgi:hypothetical protein
LEDELDKIEDSEIVLVPVDEVTVTVVTVVEELCD